jgi:ABC-2 type transport system ATP-binding protein
VGFLGPNGAGKSTTMKMITGYLQADYGKAKVCGIDVAEMPIEAKKKIGYLPEANPLYPEMYVREYLNFIAGVHGIVGREKAINQVLELVGIKAEKTKKIAQLSKGYKQRVGLAAAMIHDPEVLVLDEPTSGLDPNQIIEIRNVIKQQGKEKTVLFSSHILQEVTAICDRVIIINKGIMVANDSLANLQKSQEGKQVVSVSFQEKLPIELLDSLENKEAVIAISDTNFQIQTSHPESIRKQLLALTVSENLNIISLQTEGNSLEEVFRALTNH